jgi:hypothetical protein
MKCSNGKYKYGEHGKCVFDTLTACKRAAAAAIHVQDKSIDSVEVATKDSFTKLSGSVTQLGPSNLA